MSPADLARLKTGPKINLLYREYRDLEPDMLCEAFSKNLAVAFSGLCNEAFPPITKTSVLDLSKPRRTSVTVKGGRLNWHRQIILWMVACCEGRGTQQYPDVKPYRLWNYVCALESAEAFQIDFLCYELRERLQEIGKEQVHSEDIRVLYSSTKRGHPLRISVARSIGKATFGCRLRAWPVYVALRRDPQLKDFDDDVNEAIRCLKQVYAESVKGKAARAAKLAKRKAAKKAVRKRHQQAKENPRKMTNDDVIQQLATSSEVVTS